MRGIIAMRGEKHIQSEGNNRMLLAYTICMEMYKTGSDLRNTGFIALFSFFSTISSMRRRRFSFILRHVMTGNIRQYGNILCISV